MEEGAEKHSRSYIRKGLTELIVLNDCVKPTMIQEPSCAK